MASDNHNAILFSDKKACKLHFECHFRLGGKGGTFREGANLNPGGLFKENVTPWQYGKY